MKASCEAFRCGISKNIQKYIYVSKSHRRCVQSAFLVSLLPLLSLRLMVQPHVSHDESSVLAVIFPELVFVSQCTTPVCFILGSMMCVSSVQL